MHVRKLLAASFCLAFAAPAIAQQPATVAPAATAPTITAPAMAAPAATPNPVAVIADKAGYKSSLYNPSAELPPVLDDATTSAMPGASYSEALLAGPKVWGSVDYLLWYVRPMSTPSLISGVPAATAVDSIQQGTVLPASSDSRIFPDGRQVRFNAFNGIRGTVGAYLDPANRFGVDGSVFILESQIKKGFAANDGTPVALAQQYYNAQSGQPINLFSSLQGFNAGSITSHVESALWGADANLRMHAYSLIADRNDLLVGGRYFSLAESIQTEARSFFPSGTVLGVTDTIRTRNQFYGGQVGIASRLGAQNHGFGIETGFKLGIGGVHQEASLYGNNTFVTPAGVVNSQASGLYVQPSNAGSYSRDKFAMLTDFNLNLTYNFSSALKVSFGYQLLYVSSVVRPGTAIDPVLNDANIRYVANPTPSTINRPVFNWHATDLWLQGVTFGVNLAY